MQIVEIITDWIGLKFSDFIFERLFSCNCSIILFGRLSPITWLFNNYSSSPNGLRVNSPMRPKAKWAIDSEATRGRGIIYCFSKIQLAGQI